jgi:hypothetical protein
MSGDPALVTITPEARWLDEAYRSSTATAECSAATKLPSYARPSTSDEDDMPQRVPGRQHRAPDAYEHLDKF